MITYEENKAVVEAAKPCPGLRTEEPALHVERFFSAEGSTDVPTGSGRCLRLSGHCPQIVTAGDSIRLSLEVRNLGDEPLHEILLRVRFPLGLRHPLGASVAVPLGTLVAGEFAKVELMVAAIEAGSQVIDILLSAAGLREGHRQHTIKVQSGSVENTEQDKKHAPDEKRATDRPEIVSSAGILEHLLEEIDREATAFSEKTTSAAQERLTSDRQHGERYVIFRLTDTTFAVPIGLVVEMGRLLPITPLPNVPEWLLGVSNFRGDILSMVDLRGFFGLDPSGTKHSGRLLVVRNQSAEILVGLIVDAVEGIRVIETGKIQALRGELLGRGVPFLRGVADEDGRLLVVLDLERLLLSPDLRQFELA
jgi:purine-binding chemotaxis protein CheW